MGCDGPGHFDEKFDRSIKLKKRLEKVPLSMFTFGDFENLMILRFGSKPHGTDIQLSDEHHERLSEIAKRFEKQKKGGAR